MGVSPFSHFSGSLFCYCLLAILWCRQRFECRFETNLGHGFILLKTCTSDGYEREILLVGGGLKCWGLSQVWIAQFHRNIDQLLMYYWLASEGGHQNMFLVEMTPIVCTCCELCENLDKNSQSTFLHSQWTFVIIISWPNSSLIHHLLGCKFIIACQCIKFFPWILFFGGWLGYIIGLL
jgi:hypothetical protein